MHNAYKEGDFQLGKLQKITSFSITFLDLIEG
jgi:hypothetical protein